MKDGETVLLSMKVHPDHVFNRFKDTHIPSNFVSVELMHPMCLAEKGLRLVNANQHRKEYIANVLGVIMRYFFDIETKNVDI